MSLGVHLLTSPRTQNYPAMSASACACTHVPAAKHESRAAEWSRLGGQIWLCGADPCPRSGIVVSPAASRVKNPGKHSWLQNCIARSLFSHGDLVWWPRGLLLTPPGMSKKNWLVTWPSLLQSVSQSVRPPGKQLASLFFSHADLLADEVGCSAGRRRSVRISRNKVEAAQGCNFYEVTVIALYGGWRNAGQIVELPRLRKVDRPFPRGSGSLFRESRKMVFYTCNECTARRLVTDFFGGGLLHSTGCCKKIDPRKLLAEKHDGSASGKLGTTLPTTPRPVVRRWSGRARAFGASRRLRAMPTADLGVLCAQRWSQVAAARLAGWLVTKDWTPQTAAYVSAGR